MNPHDQIFLPVSLAGLVFALGTSLWAMRKRGVSSVLLFLLGAFVLWMALWLGSELGYRAWQAMDDPPDEAFADPEPAGYLFMGWILAGIYCRVVQYAALGVNRWRKGRTADGPPA